MTSFASAQHTVAPLASLARVTRDGAGAVSQSGAPTRDIFGTSPAPSLVRNPSGTHFPSANSVLSATHAAPLASVSGPRALLHQASSASAAGAALRDAAADTDGAAPAKRLGIVDDMERVAVKLTHAFPWSAVGQAHVAMGLGRRESELQGKLKKGPRERIIAHLSGALTKGRPVPSAACYLCLAELHLKDGQPEAGFAAAKAGLRYVNRRKRLSKEPLVQVGLALRLEASRALLALGRLDAAEEGFNFLKDWSSEGEVTFAYGAGCVPTSVRQQALRGLAKVQEARGNITGAKFEYEKILGKALRGYGPSEHWAHSEYGWILFQQGEFVTARQHLNMAIDVASMTAGVPSSERARHHYRLGRILYSMRKFREDPEYAYAALMEAAGTEGPDQASAFAWLGHYFRDVTLDAIKARKCYRRALDLDPLASEAGLALCDLLRESNSEELVGNICREVLAADGGAVWALQRLGKHLLWSNRPEKAILRLQAALRCEPGNAEAWEALGAAYEHMGRLTAALKTYQRAVDLDSTRLYALSQAAAICSVMGDTEQALSLLARADAVHPDHPAVLLGVCQTHSQLAEVHVAIGAYTLAAQNCAAGEAAAQRATRKHGTLEATWKSLGDCLIRETMLPTSAQPLVSALLSSRSPDGVSSRSDGTSAAPPAAGGAVGGAAGAGAAAGGADADIATLTAAYMQRFDKARAARRAYAAAVHLNPLRPASWSDLALTQHQEVVLQGALPGAGASAARESAAHKSALAERVIAGALKLAPDVPGLWSALGSIAVSPAKREYALRRATLIDGSSALTWLKLGRLYHAHGHGHAVTECYDNARAQDPKLAAIWEAMAAFTALPTTQASHLTGAALAESTELYKHALGLGAGAEADLGYAYGALRGPGFPQALAFAAAHRAQPMQPLNPVVYHTLALVLEHQGAPAAAARLLRVAAGLLAQPGVAAAAPPAHFAPVLLPPAGGQLARAVQLDLARALAKSGDSAAAAALYGDLEGAGEALDAHAQAAYGAALLAAGDAERAHAVMQRALQAAGTPAAAADAAAALVRSTAAASGAAAAVALAEALAPALASFAAPPADAARLWLAVLGAAASTGDAPSAAHARSALRPLVHGAWRERDAVEAGLQSGAEAAADMRVADAALAKTAAASARHVLHAVHTCPWSPSHRAVAAAAACRGARGSAAAAAPRLLAARQPVQATDASGGGLPERGAAGGAAAALASRHAALPDTQCASAQPALRHAVAAAYACVRGDPAAVAPRYQLALLLTQRALLASASAASAASACALTLRLLYPSAAACAELSRATLTTMQVHLLLAQSIAELLCSAQPGADGASAGADSGACYRAMEAAQGALATAAASPLAGACYRQIAACHLAGGTQGGVSAAEAALRQGADLADAPSVCLLAQLLADSGRRDEAVAALSGAANAVLQAHDASQSSASASSGGLGEADTGWAAPSSAADSSAWLGALRLRRVALLSSWDDVEGAKAVLGGGLAGPDAAIASTFVAAAQLRSAERAEAGDKRHVLADVRGALKAASERCARRDVSLAGTLVLADAERARGREDAASSAVRAAAKQAARSGLAREQPPGDGAGHGLAAPALALCAWAE